MLSSKAMPQGTSSFLPVVSPSGWQGSCHPFPHTALLDTTRVLGRKKVVFPLPPPHPTSGSLRDAAQT